MPKSPYLPPFPAGLDTFEGPWTRAMAAHLLRRCTFGPSPEMIDEALEMGLEATVDQLLSDVEVLDQPLKNTLDEPNEAKPWLPVLPEPEVNYGETWVNEGPLGNTGDEGLDQSIRVTRFRSVRSWVWKNFYENRISILQKISIFWHNHFVVADFANALEQYEYFALLQEYAVGDFRQFCKEMTLNIAMLRYLDGRENTKEAPNENYARELLELFTVGKGALAGPGDYSTFTEQDVVEMAKILTGWRCGIQENELFLLFSNNKHSEGSKQLSHRFNNAIIEENGEEEYSDLIDIIFEQDATSINICEKLYRYFVQPNIDDEIRTEIINPMAEVLRDNNYEIKSALNVLLKSAHFFDVETIGCMIKNPIDFLLSCTRSLNYELSEEVADSYYSGNILFGWSEPLQLIIFGHPNVAGWQAYYQEPLYYRFWINSTTLPIRQGTSQFLVNGGFIQSGGQSIYIPPAIPILDFAASIEQAEEPTSLITAIATIVFPVQITASQIAFLKEILIPGLPDFEWTVEYEDYLADPDNPDKSEAIENKLCALLVAMLDMPEFQLM